MSASLACLARIIHAGTPAGGTVTWRSPVADIDEPQTYNARSEIQAAVNEIKRRPAARFALMSRLDGEARPRLDYAGYGAMEALSRLVAGVEWCFRLEVDELSSRIGQLQREIPRTTED
jgi:hypothetical protein